MIDQIIEYLRERPEGVASAELAERFLKFKNAGHVLALKAVSAILEKDRRFVCDDQGRWSCVRRSAPGSADLLASLPWVAVLPLMVGRRALQVSIWSASPGDVPRPLLNEWLADPAHLSAEERQLLGEGEVPSFDPARRAAALEKIAELLQAARPFFVSSNHRGLLAAELSLIGETLTDDGALAGHLFRAASESVPRPLDLASCYAALFAREPVIGDAGRNGMLLAECLVELLERLKTQGIETLADLEAAETVAVEAFDFSGKRFGAAEIAGLPKRPGVYGFKDRNGAYLYVGKATSLKRRIAGYFGETDESPAKLERMRRESVELMTSPCGSELECLLYEHRLIQKYRPELNTQRTIEERKGRFSPLADCIVLLPHADEGKGQSVWYRGNQKIALKPFRSDFGDTGTFPQELQTFFFSDKLPAAATDFPEQEIATRWISRHREHLLIVPADRMASGEEIYRAMKAYWSDMGDAGPGQG